MVDSNPLIFLMRVNYVKSNDCELVHSKLYSLPEKTIVAELSLRNIECFEMHYYADNNRESYKWISVTKNLHHKCERSFRNLYNFDGVFVCQHCNRPIMKVVSDNIFIGAIYVKCKCGAIYDNKRTRKKTNDFSEEI